MEMVAIVPHALLRAAPIRVPIVAGIPLRAAAIRVPIVAGIPLRAAAIRVPIAAVVGIQLPVAAVAADTRLLVAVAGIQLPAAAGVAVGSTPPAVTTDPTADDKNFELLPGGPPSRPLFLSPLSVSLNRRLREARQSSPAPTKIDCGAESVSMRSLELLTTDGE